MEWKRSGKEAQKSRSVKVNYSYERIPKRFRGGLEWRPEPDQPAS